MSCSNCFNGCSEIVSDQCVKYTGIDVPVLGIQNGDSLSYVEQALITFLTSTLDGSGIKLTIDPTIICNLVKNYLPTCEDLTLTNVLTALIKAACDLQAQVSTNLTSINTINAQLATLNGPYTIGDCVIGVTSTSGTHAVLQAVMNTLCAFILDVETNYVLLADLDTLIADYLANLPTNTLVSRNMVPYVAYEYYGSLTNFDSQTGAGIGDYANVYLCNGLNGTPDKRGVVTVGAIALVPGGPLPSAVNPSSSPFNPNYVFNGPIIGSNSVTLTTNQLPSHTHSATATVTPNPHDHFVFNTSIPTTTSPISNSNYTARGFNEGTNSDYQASGTALVPTLGKTSPVTLAADINVAPFGGSLPHANNQPAIAAYYIMYIP